MCYVEVEVEVEVVDAGFGCGMGGKEVMRRTRRPDEWIEARA